ncbi:hypothetical protein ACQ4PT_055851 [Festuca glaucescens]
MSSGASSAPGFRVASGRRGSEGRSPVTYRQSPMAYEPVKLCNYNPPRKAPRWISWSGMNPGRRYYACVDALNGRGCGYVEWHDPPLPEFWSELIGDLRDEVWRLRGLQQAAPQVVEEARDGRLQAMQDELREKTEEIAALKGNYDKVMLAFVVFVFGLLAGKMFMQ